MDKQKILDKIKKCLALSKSANAHEAAAALRQAQALMRKHGISEADIEALGFSSETIDIPVQRNVKLPEYLSLFLALMRHAFGVKPVTGGNRRVSDISYTVTYFGPTARVMMASYAHTVVWRAMNRAWKEHLREWPEVKNARGARSSFFIGWIDEVWGKVEAIGFTEDEAAKTELLINSSCKGLKPAETSRVKLDGSHMVAGATAAASFNIHRPMDVVKKRLT